ncbi:TonB-dependent receptor [Niveispirillum sp.]|uniref:TonB-dependent receptor n=1 Tax=Niveispirillum sp. TaxID=1917217 RepID=UPI001B4D170C|nr:TonB-dependent receptor [Niveispirillum sp.]MBP7338103.1 TonB-dependent receptor [Niveispirillum sp.]
MGKGVLRCGAAAMAVLVCGQAGAEQEKPKETHLSPLARAIEGDRASKEEPVVLEEIIVTAQRRQQSLQRLSMGLTLLDSRNLEEANIRKFEDVVNMAPSVSVTSDSSGNGNSFNIRGVGSQAFGATVEPSVAVVVDGVVMGATNEAFGELFDVQRVEVLRGPQGTLFGKNASAGAISIITKRPTRDPEGQVEMELGEQDTRRGRAVVSGPLSDSVAARLAAFYVKQGDYIENLSGTDIGERKQYGARGQFLYEPTENFEARLIAEYSKTEGGGGQFIDRFNLSTDRAAYLAPTVAGEKADIANVNSVRDGGATEVWGASLEARYSFEPLDLISITAYRKKQAEADARLDSDGLPVDTPALTPRPGQSVLPTGSFDTDADGYTDSFIGTYPYGDGSDAEQFTQELRLESYDRGNVGWVAGTYLFVRNTHSSGLQRRAYLGDALVIPPNLTASTCTITMQGTTPDPARSCVIGNMALEETRGPSRTEVFSYAGFGQVDWSLTDALKLVGGMRVTRDHVEAVGELVNRQYDAYVQTPTGFVRNGARTSTTTGGRKVEAEETGYSGKAALEYNFSKELFGYASYARGYKGPVPRQDGEVVDPETVDSYEVGLRSTQLGGRLLVNVAAFLSNYDDFQVQAYDDDSQSFQLENAGQVRSKGVELDVIARPFSNVSLQIGGAYIDAEIREFANAACYGGQTAAAGCTYVNARALDVSSATTRIVTVAVPQRQDLAGARPPNTAKWKFSAVGRYEVPLPYDGVNTYLQGAYRWQSSMQHCLTQHPECIQDSYGVLDAALGVEFFDGALDLQVFAKNLTNSFYVSTIIEVPTQSASVGRLGSTAHVVPREAGRFLGGRVTVRY